jgi:hypothetical protein
MRDVKEGIDVRHQGVGAVHDPMRIDAPPLARQAVTPLAIAKLEDGMGGEAGTERGGDVLHRPVHDLDEGLPEGLVRQVGLGDIGAGDDEGIQAVLADALEGLVITLDVGPGLGLAWQGLETEGVNVELGDLIALADEAEKLAFGRRQGGVRHHVAQADVQLADVLLVGAGRVQDVLALGAQALEGRQVVMGDDRHLMGLGMAGRVWR